MLFNRVSAGAGAAAATAAAGALKLRWLTVLCELDLY